VTANRNETKQNIDEFPHACHKRFSTLEEAEMFISQYRETRRCIDQRRVSEGDALEDMMLRLRLDEEETQGHLELHQLPTSS
jgi:hypothetical protein